MKNKRQFRASTPCGEGHRMKLCESLEEAREFLKSHGNGIIEKKQIRMVTSLGYGLGRIEYDKPWSLNEWNFLEKVQL